jgi:hypothetical protein
VRTKIDANGTLVNFFAHGEDFVVCMGGSGVEWMWCEGGGGSTFLRSSEANEFERQEQNLGAAN